MEKLKILHINTLDNQGGASQVAVDLLGNPETENRMVVMKKTINNNNVLQLKKRIIDFVFMLFDKTLWKLGQRRSLRALLSLDSELNFTYKKLKKLKVYRDADIIHLHNLHGGYFDLNSLLKIAKEKKIVWTLHDMWALTGGEAHTFENENYKKGIGYTPYINLYPLLNPIVDRRQHFLNKKKEIYKQIHEALTIVPVSKWLENCFRESFVYDPFIKVRTIHNGVDTSIFRNKHYTKTDKPKILFFNSADPFKGSHLFTNIIQRIENEFDLWVIGEKVKIKIRHKHLPYINDRTSLSELYNHTDILIVPSLAESFGLIVAEAMACGVCVIGSDVGGIPEILNNSCGFLFKNNDENSLLDAIEKSLSDLKSTREKGSLAEKKVLDNFTLEINFRNYLKLYNEIFGFKTQDNIQSQLPESKKPLNAMDFFK